MFLHDFYVFLIYNWMLHKIMTDSKEKYGKLNFKNKFFFNFNLVNIASYVNPLFIYDTKPF